jgi:hypothetical protein
MATCDTPHPLMAGEPVRVRHDGHEYVVRPESVSQRNWSRVGIGQVTGGQAPAQRVFLKQFLDRSGIAHSEHFAAERDGCRIATGIPQDGLQISTVTGESLPDCLLVYPAMRVITPDELLRRDPAQFRALLPGLLQAMTSLLRALPAAAAMNPGLKRKQRSFRCSVVALNFKGLDIRNIGIPLDDQRRPSGDRPVMFDFGRPYLAPMEEAAAKLFVSCGLLNWGWPLARFIHGPDTAIIEAAATAFAPYLDREAIAFEVEHEARVRLGEPPQGSSAAIRLGKQLVIGTVGRWHLGRLRALLGDLPALRTSVA